MAVSTAQRRWASRQALPKGTVGQSHAFVRGMARVPSAATPIIKRDATAIARPGQQHGDGHYDEAEHGQCRHLEQAGAPGELVGEQFGPVDEDEADHCHGHPCGEHERERTNASAARRRRRPRGVTSRRGAPTSSRNWAADAASTTVGQRR